MYVAADSYAVHYLMHDYLIHDMITRDTNF